MSDSKLNSKQYHELYYIARKYGAPMDLVRSLQAEAGGRSKKNIYQKLEEAGYKVQPSKAKAEDCIAAREGGE